MKKKLFKILSVLLLVLVLVFVAHLMATKVNAQLTDIELTAETFDELNPLVIAGSPLAGESPGGIVSRLLNFLFPLAGLILFLLISWGGFEILVSSADQKGMEVGKNRITAAIVGFLLLFSTYWMAQIVELIFRIKIL
ncbi:hypothetical protein KKD03_05590 [Patescibacteria group bacterium]|nr:hypothetical protein [Patescibacteria group bacterium]